jgi:hypothetical protein
MRIIAAMRTLRYAALTAPLFVLGCVGATPVTPAAISAEDAPKLKAALVGTCTVTATQKEGSDKKSDASGLSFTFAADGNASYTAAGPFGGSITPKFTYKLEGRNILMDGPFKAIRVDDFSGPEMKWFLYDLSLTYYCTKKG